ncbi:MAG TPA: SMC-Scp complex subunit ScpB [Opitutaceae bacterium]|nr:SMC-Scp complex subunit ScpB [Opitutaceae bacterium]
MAFNLQKVLKALLFSSNQPLTIAEIQEVIVRFHDSATTPEAEPAPAAAPGTVEAAEPPPPAEPGADAELYADVPALVTAAQIREAMDQLAAELRAADDGILLTEGAQGFRLVTHPRYARWVRALRNEAPPVKLSPTAMETLAVIAYRQPVTRAEIEHIRGVSAEAGLAKLLERELIYIVGRADLPGRPIQYGTTEAFLEFVGVRSLEELPATDVLSRQQINEWLQNAMRARHPSDSDMGLEEEGREEQLSLADAARAVPSPEPVAGEPAAPATPQPPA